MFTQEEYGLSNFQLASEEEIDSALGLAGESTTLKKILTTSSSTFYKPIPLPLPGDYLMHNSPDSQTFSEFSNNQGRTASDSRDVVYLAQLYYGESIKMDESFVNGLSLLAESYFYGMKIKLIENGFDLENPGLAVQKRTSSRTKALQLNAKDILSLLANTIPEDGYCFITFTDRELFTKSSGSCFSESDQRRRVGVFSVARLDPFSGRNIKEADDAKILKNYFTLFNRSAKLLVKEVCLQFGIKTCVYYLCVLNGFMNLKEFDKRPLELCVVCLRKLYGVIGLREKLGERSRMNNPYLVMERFVKIKDVLQEENFQAIFPKETKWYEARIQAIKDEL